MVQIHVTPRRSRRLGLHPAASPPGGGGGAENVIGNLERVDLLKLLGILFALFSVAMIVSLVEMPDHEPQIDIFRYGRENGGGTANSSNGGGGGAHANLRKASSRRRQQQNRSTNKKTPKRTGGIVDSNIDVTEPWGGITRDPLEMRYTPAVFPLVVPPSSWPVPKVNLKDEYQYEYIIHPGDDSTKMTVPRFWSRPLHNNTLMERDLAMKIGTCTNPDPKTGSFARGTACPEDQRTIFVALASYRDYQCRETLDSIFARAKYPERIRVAVVDQKDDAEMACTAPVRPCIRDPEQAICNRIDQVELYTMDRRLAVGPAFARHIAYRYYRGEYYSLQIDAQTTFVQDWDEMVIDQHDATGDEMAVLSHYPMDIIDSIDAKTGRALEKERTVMCLTHYLAENYLENDLWYLKDIPPGHGPTLEPFWSAAFSFARGHFVVNVPYDMYQTMLFSEEEISVALRGFTVGYDYFAPSSNVCFHTYSKGENEKYRKSVPLFWENEKRYDDIDYYRDRVKSMIGLSPEKNIHSWNHVGRDVYGLGGARKVTKFFDLYGIDPYNKVHEHNLCDFVEDGLMHKIFMKHLRRNGMGIDYGKIDFQFTDPRADEDSKSDNGQENVDEDEEALDRDDDQYESDEKKEKDKDEEQKGEGEEEKAQRDLKSPSKPNEDDEANDEANDNNDDDDEEEVEDKAVRDIDESDNKDKAAASDE